MDDIRVFYNFLSELWHFIKTTKAPAQNDNAEWNRIIDRSNELSTEFIHKMGDWMEYLRDQSIKEGSKANG